jgi:hypothetical protein
MNVSIEFTWILLIRLFDSKFVCLCSFEFVFIVCSDAVNATATSTGGAAHQSSSSERHRRTSGHSFGANEEDEGRVIKESYSSSRRYNYRSRSDVDSPRRYASQTLLDGARPGPITPHARRDALHSLQRELDSLSRSPDAAARSAGYASDSGGYQNDTIRSRTRTGAVSSAEYGMSGF